MKNATIFLFFLLLSALFLFKMPTTAEALDCDTYGSSECDDSMGTCWYPITDTVTCPDDSSGCSSTLACQSYSATYSCKAESSGGGCLPDVSNSADDSCNTSWCTSGQCSGGECVKAVAPKAPTLSSPANTATGISTTPTLSWDYTTGAQCYFVYITSGYSKSTTDTSVVIPSSSALGNSTSYTWYAFAYSGALSGSSCTGTASPVSDQWSFTTVAACTPVNATLSDWGACSSNVQTRTCTGANSCGDTTCGGAILSRTCPSIGTVSPSTATAGTAQAFSVTATPISNKIISTCTLYIDGGNATSMTLPSSCSTNGTACTATASYTFASAGSYAATALCSDNTGGYITSSNVNVTVAVSASVPTLSYPTNTWQRLWYAWGTGQDDWSAAQYLGTTTYDETGNNGQITNSDWGSSALYGSTADKIKFTSSREIYIPTAGDYKIHVCSDDGLRLWVDGVLQKNIWSNHACGDGEDVTVNLTAGDHKFKIDFYEYTGNAKVEFVYTLAQSTDTINACSALTSCPADYTCFATTIAGACPLSGQNKCISPSTNFSGAEQCGGKSVVCCVPPFNQTIPLDCSVGNAGGGSCVSSSPRNDDPPYSPNNGQSSCDYYAELYSNPAAGKYLKGTCQIGENRYASYCAIGSGPYRDIQQYGEATCPNTNYTPIENTLCLRTGASYLPDGSCASEGSGQGGGNEVFCCNYTTAAPAPQQCLPPTGFSCSVIGDTIKGNWTGSVANANYIFKACTAAGNCTESGQVSGTENYILGLGKGIEYTLSAKVSSNASSCTTPSNWSNEAKCTIPTTASTTYILWGKAFIDTDSDGLLDTDEVSYSSPISFQLSSSSGSINGAGPSETITTNNWSRTVTSATYTLNLTVPANHTLTGTTVIQGSTTTQSSTSNTITLTNLNKDTVVNFGLTPPKASTVMMQGHFVDADGSYISNVVTGTAVTITGGGLAADQTNYATNSSADPSFWKTASPPTSTSPTLPASTTAYTVTAPAITGYTLTSYSVWARDDSTNSKSGITHTNYTSGNAASVTLQYDGNYADIFFKYTKDVATVYTCVDNGGVCSATACQLPQTPIANDTCPSSGNCCTKYVTPPQATTGTSVIEGYVWDDTTQEVPVGKDKGTGENCYTGTSTIDLYLNAGQTPFKTASTTGCTKYSFTGLAAGTYTVKIRTLPSGYTQTPNQTLSVTIPN